MGAYCKKQIEIIERLARLLGVSVNKAAYYYVERGLAKSFAEKHRKEYNLTK